VVLSEKERRALEALARHPDGCDEAVLLADGFTVGQLADLGIDGLATKRPTHIPLDARKKPAIWMKISRQARGRSQIESRFLKFHCDRNREV
jgi:hypothetical protein